MTHALGFLAVSKQSLPSHQSSFPIYMLDLVLSCPLKITTSKIPPLCSVSSLDWVITTCKHTITSLKKKNFQKIKIKNIFFCVYFHHQPLSQARSAFAGNFSFLLFLNRYVVRYETRSFEFIFPVNFLYSLVSTHHR